jgi:hypothetical protein
MDSRVKVMNENSLYCISPVRGRSPYISCVALISGVLPRCIFVTHHIPVDTKIVRSDFGRPKAGRGAMRPMDGEHKVGLKTGLRIFDMYYPKDHADIHQI